MNLAAVTTAAQGPLAPGLPEPRVVLIGFSRAGESAISAIRSTLPGDKKHEAGSLGLRMARDHAINPFDTPLGCRRPMPMDREILVTIVASLAMYGQGTGLPQDLLEIAGIAVDAAYERVADSPYAEGARPHGYEPGTDSRVDTALAINGIRLSGQPTWWECVDRLAEAGALREAMLAQRHAVPRLRSLMAGLPNGAMERFGGVDADGGRTLPRHFLWAVGEALTRYPVLDGPTQVDLEDCRILSLDLGGAAPPEPLRQTPHGRKQAALMYMLARSLLNSQFNINDAGLRTVPQTHMQWHAEHQRVTRLAPRRIVYDDFEQVAGDPGAACLVTRDMLYGRAEQGGTSVAVISSDGAIVPAEMQRLAGRIWLQARDGSPEDFAVFQQHGLPQWARDCFFAGYEDGVPPRGNLDFVLIDRTGSRPVVRYVRNHLDSKAAWAVATDPHDAELRSWVAKNLGMSEALRRLSERFPDGSAFARGLPAGSDIGQVSREMGGWVPPFQGMRL